MPHDDLIYIQHMLETARRIMTKTEGLDRHAFFADDDRQLAVLHLVQVIGESARRVSAPFKERHPGIPWREIVGMRTKIVHDYLETDFNVVWQTAQKDVPALVILLETIVANA